MRKIFSLLTILILFGCSSNNMNKKVYDALIQRDCIEKTGEPHCDSHQPSYEDYTRERNEILNRQNESNDAY